ncbi:hypothetical protein [Streptomyces viridochromogenes]|uniref:Integral membrane protein n=1 Tax=Streptomyces viridochromogenes Tue57 TaxID=1160705 RepID=L8PDD4_STRVR|nr:hypothetical protein [Streptomyces viridochromogenes]ELS53337.1 hypothetical protein STVIR_5709 [Streptomyces viridochromogenes Tue57]
MARIAAVLLTLVGAAALVLSAFQPWYEGREPREVALTDLFTGLEPAAAGGAAASMLLPLVAVAAVAVLGLLVRSRAVLAVACVAGLATGILWTVQQIRAVAPVAFEVTEVQRGLWNAGGGVLALVIAAIVLPPRT